MKAASSPAPGLALAAMRQRPHRFEVVREEWAIVASLATTALFLHFGDQWLGNLDRSSWVPVLLAWLLAVTVISVFAVARHAEILANKLGEPLGSLVLTLAVTAIESMVIVSNVFAGVGGSGLARETMYAVIMIVLNGMVGLALLLGGLRHHEQSYNLQGANSFLAVIVPVSVLGLVLPSFTESSPGHTLSTLHAIFLVGMSVGLYLVFLFIQNLRHRHYFLPSETTGGIDDELLAPPLPGHARHSTLFHAVCLLAYFIPVALLSKRIGIPTEWAIRAVGAPPALGGLLVALLVLAPESVGAVRAALANQLQRSVNILLGSVLATISLTMPVVLVVGLLTGRELLFGLDMSGITMLVLTLLMSQMTFSNSRTNVLLGAVHLLIFFAYIMLMFDR